MPSSLQANLKALKSQEVSTLLIAALCLSSIVLLPASKAEASFQEIELLTSGYPSGANNAESVDLRFLAERSQRKTLTREGLGPYTMTHDNANNSLDYSYVTDILYGATTGSGHSSCTVGSSVTETRGCAAQLRESDVRSNSNVAFSYNSITTRSATLFSNGSINPTPRGGSGSNLKDGFVTFASIFGPEVWSKPFQAGPGDMVSYEWSATGGGDDYEIYGFLVRVSDSGGCAASTDFGGATEAEKRSSHKILSYGRGKQTRGKLGTAAYGQVFFTAAGAIESSGCYRFRLVNGTFDASGGYVVGATFEVRNLRLGRAQTINTSPIADLIMSSSSQTVAVSASSNISGATLRYTLVSNPASSPCSIANSSSGVVTVDVNKSGYCVVAVDSAAVGSAAAAETAYVGFTVRTSATAPVYSGGARVLGNATICSVLTVEEGTWANGGQTITSTSYSWFRDGQLIAGESGSSYQISDSDLGKAISFQVTKTNSVGSTNGQSSPVTVVDARLTALRISGGSLSPTFGGCVTSFSSTVVEATISVVATMNSSGTSLIVSGSAEASGQSSSPISLQPGLNTISITVTTGLFSQTTSLFVTYAAPPTVEALAPTFTSGTIATLSARVHPNGFSTTAITFLLTPTGGTGGSPIQGVLNPSAATGNSPTLIQQSVSNLVSGGTYLFSVTAQNANGSSTATYSFQTPDAPNVITGLATNIGANSASISYEVNTFNKSTVVTFSLSLNPEMLSATRSSVGVLSPSLTATSGVFNLTGLLPGRTYYYTFGAENDAGSNTGVVRSFLTIGQPTVEVAASVGGERQMTLRATINPGGLRTTGIRFYYSTNNFATSTSVTATPSTLFGTADATVEATITNVSANTYKFRAEATNDAGTVVSSTDGQVVVTDAVPSVTLSAPSSVAIGGDITVIVRFSEAVTGFTSGDIQILPNTTGYLAAAEQELATGEYSVRLFRNSGSFSGSMTVSLAANTANEAFGSGRGNLQAISITVFVGASAPDISLANLTYVFTASQAISMISPSNAGGAVSSWGISPAAPSGLAFNTSNGTLTGTPTSQQASTNYVISATNAFGSDTLTITIEIRPQSPDLGFLAVSVYQFNRNVAITPISPSNGGGAATSWTAVPSLPSGLTISQVTGAITGIPASTQSAINYTITAINSGGSDSLNISIEILDQAPSVSYASSQYSFVAGRAITTLSPNTVGDNVTSWLVSPALPTGLVFDVATGRISGVPSSTFPLGSFTITASNSGGSSAVTIQIEILSAPVAQSPETVPRVDVPLVSRIEPRIISASNQVVVLNGSQLAKVSHVVVDGIRYATSGTDERITFQIGRHENGVKSIFLIGEGLGTYEILRAIEVKLPTFNPAALTSIQVQRAGSQLLVYAPGYLGLIEIFEGSRLIGKYELSTSVSALVVNRRVLGVVSIRVSGFPISYTTVNDLMWFENWNLGQVSGSSLNQSQVGRVLNWISNKVLKDGVWIERDSAGAVSKFICTGLVESQATNSRKNELRRKAEKACMESAQMAGADSTLSFFSQVRETTSRLTGRVLVTLKGLSESIFRITSVI